MAAAAQKAERQALQVAVARQRAEVESLSARLGGREGDSMQGAALRYADSQAEVEELKLLYLPLADTTGPWLSCSRATADNHGAVSPRPLPHRRCLPYR